MNFNNRINFKPSFVILALFFTLIFPLSAQKATDIVVFGDNTSETTHSLTFAYSETYTGQFSLPARRFLPRTDAESCLQTGATTGVYGGYCTFRVAVDGNLQNYFSAKLSGNEYGGTAETNRLVLAIQASDGSFRELGYRHGDPFVEQSWSGVLPGTFFYRTAFIPRTFTDGKDSVTLRVKATGRYYSYGSRWDYASFQRVMVGKSVGVYRGYSHTNPVFSLNHDDILGPVTNYKSATTRVRSNKYDASTLGSCKSSVISTVQGYLNDADDYIATDPNNYKSEIEYLAVAYNTDWVTNAYHKPATIQKLVKLIDNDVRNYIADNGTVGAWGGSFGRPGYAMCLVWDAIKDSMSNNVNLGKGTKLRSSYWADMFYASFVYSLGDRRIITNQCLEASMSLYGANMALLKLNDPRAWSQKDVLDMVYESLGLLEWRGSYDVASQRFTYDKAGKGYYMMTEKATSHEPGWVSQDCYGNLGPKMVDLFYMTGDSTILKWAVKHEKAQMHFHVPGIINEGGFNYRAILTEGVICWRNRYDPGKLHYVDPYVVEASKDPELLGVAKQLYDDGQLMNQLGVNDETKSLRCVSAYNIIKAAAAGTQYTAKDPTTPSEPDFAWSDEENGVISIKRGFEQLFISFYDRGYTINNVARAHLVLDSTNRSVEFRPNITRYVASGVTTIDDGRPQPDWGGTPCDNPVTAYSGTVYEMPLLISGQTHQDRAIANFYASRFGNYVIAMNTTKRSWNSTYAFNMPKGTTSAYNVGTKATETFSGSVTVAPGTTVVYYLGDTVTTNYPVTEAYLTAKNIIPGTVECEDYSEGGANVAYFDNDKILQNIYREGDSIDLAPTTKTIDGNYWLSNTNTGEWINYTLNVEETGRYKCYLSYKNAIAQGKIKMYVDGKQVYGSTSVLGATNGSWYDLPITFDLTKGVRTLQIFFVAGGPMFDRMKFTQLYGKSNNMSLPGVIETEDYDDGGEGVGYHEVDTYTANLFRPKDKIDFEPSSTYPNDANYWLSNTITGEWVKYTVNVNTAGTYDVSMRYLNGNATDLGKIKLYVDDSPVYESPSSISKTGSWTTWGFNKFTTSNISIGTHTLKLEFVEGGVYIDNFTFSLTPTAVNDVDAENCISIYPNPTQEYINVSGVNEYNSSLKIGIYSIQGKILKQVTFTSGTSPIYVGDLSNGIYFVRISDGNKSIQNLKLIKR